jgi:hypothetical protein
VAGGPKIQAEADVPAAYVERLLVETGGRQGVGERRHGAEEGYVPVIEAEVVDPPLDGVYVRRVVGVAPVEAARIQAVEQPLFRVDEAEVEAEYAGPRGQIHHAAVGIETAADIGAEAISKIDVARKPILGRGGRTGGRIGRWGRGRFLRFGRRRRCRRRLRREGNLHRFAGRRLCPRRRDD